MYVDTPIKVRYGETDMMGVVYHANYLLYFEDARVDFLDKVGFPYTRIEKAGFMSPIYHLDIQYRSPLRYGEAAFVRTSVEKSMPTRTIYRQQVFRADTGACDVPAGNAIGSAPVAPLVDAAVTVCLVDRATFQPVSIKRNFPELYAFYDTILEPRE